MKLWLLRPTENNDLWDPWWDKTFGLVVRAETEQQARKMAADNDVEGGATWTWISAAWIDASNSTCKELTAEGEPGIIIVDFCRA